MEKEKKETFFSLHKFNVSNFHENWLIFSGGEGIERYIMSRGWHF
jgi:predicted nucleotidyltransferase component of viral defense system